MIRGGSCSPVLNAKHTAFLWFIKQTGFRCDWTVLLLLIIFLFHLQRRTLKEVLSTTTHKKHNQLLLYSYDEDIRCFDMCHHILKCSFLPDSLVSCLLFKRQT